MGPPLSRSGWHLLPPTYSPPGPNREILEKVLAEAGHKAHTIRVLPKANHLFLQAETGVQTEYPRLRAFIPGYFDELGPWLRAFLATPGVQIPITR